MHAAAEHRSGWILAGVLILGVLVGLSASGPLGVAAEEGASSRSSRGENATLEDKLDQILSNQQLILQKFDAVMEELRIIKVRATLRGSS